jgi:hypothetical protein
MNDHAERAKEIAIKVLAGGYDLLLACRELADLRGRLPSVADDVMDTFTGVASEVDDLPIGTEREHWAADALRSKDIEAADYRERVKDAVAKALQELLMALAERHFPSRN